MPKGLLRNARHTNESVIRIQQRRAHDIHNSTRASNSDDVLLADGRLEDRRGQEVRQALLEVRTSIIRRRVPTRKLTRQTPHVVIRMKLAELLKVGLHVLPAQHVLSNRHDKRTFRMRTITGMKYRFVSVNVAKINSLGSQDLLGATDEL